jgi:tetratricopeptide (TPR) repeat protein
MESTTIEQLPVSHKAWAWFEANKKPALLGVAVLLVGGLIVALVIYRQDQRDIAAGEALSNLSVPQMAAGATRTPEALLKVAAEYPKSQAGARAVLLAAGGLYTEGKYAEARTQFERFRRDYADSPFVGEAMLGIAACADAQGEARKAMTAYRELIDRRPGDYVLPQARFALARLHEAQNEPEQARNLYEEVERTDPYGSMGDESRMRLEELKTKYPKLFAAPVAPAAAPVTMPAATAATNNASPVSSGKR